MLTDLRGSSTASPRASPQGSRRSTGLRLLPSSRAVPFRPCMGWCVGGSLISSSGSGAGLVLPRCTTEAMTLHLAEISQAVAPDAHAVLLLDRAGWHVSTRLKVPSNITLVPLPAKAPELNPVENIWQFMRENWISNRVFTSYTDILDHCCDAWNKLVDQPWTIMSIGLRDWLNA